MKRFIFNLFFLSIFVVLLVFSASAATQPAYEMEHTMIVARLDTNTSQGWNAYYQYTETWPFDDSYLGFSTPQLQLILDSKTFVHTDFKIFRTDGKPLAYAGNDVTAALSNIFIQHWLSYNDTWYTWEKAIVCSVTYHYTDGTQQVLNDNSFVYNSVTQEFTLTTEMNQVPKDVQSLTFSAQYWPYRYDGLYSPATYFQVTYFRDHFPRFDIFSFTPGGSGGSSGGSDLVDPGELIGPMPDYSDGVSTVMKYQIPLLAVSWILDQVFGLPVFSDLLFISAALGVIVLFFGVSLTVSKAISRSHKNRNH